uniref:Uncharacterized protein n=1 Tax=Arundo donax TaxID=35708 RepID=A0A0A9FYU5_ARUDO
MELLMPFVLSCHLLTGGRALLS